jgi:high-affinity Fe2+/Pb2+ permease
MPKRTTHLVGLVVGAVVASVVAGPLGFFVFCGLVFLALLIGRPKSSE